MRIVPAFLAESDDGIPLRGQAQCWLNWGLTDDA